MKCSDFDCGSGECWNIPLSEYDMIQIDMEIPKSCADCPLFGSEDDNYYWGVVQNNRQRYQKNNMLKKAAR